MDDVEIFLRTLNMIILYRFNQDYKSKPCVLQRGFPSLDHNGGDDADDHENDNGGENTDGDDGARVDFPLPTPRAVQV